MTALDKMLYEFFEELLRKPIEREVDYQLGTNFDFISLRRVFVEPEGRG